MDALIVIPYRVEVGAYHCNSLHCGGGNYHGNSLWGGGGDTYQCNFLQCGGGTYHCNSLQGGDGAPIIITPYRVKMGHLSL